MKSTQGNLAVFSSIRSEKQLSATDHPFHEILLALQTTLDLERVLDIFSRYVEPIVPHAGYRFECPEHSIKIRGGSLGRQRCTYSLDIEDKSLGSLTLSRGQRFSEQELMRLEACLCRLLYPLRNALLYHAAVESAYIDPLTGVRNRSALLLSLQREWELSRRHGYELSLLLLDIDHFKLINDTFGHDQGDAVLRTAASCISDVIRGSDMVFRYGGEEFVVLLSNTDGHGAARIAERIRKALQQTPCPSGEAIPVRITASIGRATLKPDEAMESLLKRSDQAMYLAKRSGRNRVAGGAE
jgi:diguanylate cyclase (GGDEF)-like protein